MNRPTPTRRAPDREPADREPADREPADREPADREPADREPAQPARRLAPHPLASRSRRLGSLLSLTALAALAALTVLTTAGCSRRDTSERRPLVVFAASSLTEAFTVIERDFEALHPTVDVQLSFAGSQVLRLQIEQGARADVFASANPEHMTALSSADRVHGANVFAHNSLVVIVPRETPGAIGAFEELPRAERLVVGAPTVPVGRYTREMLERAATGLGAAFADAVRGHIVSEESNVRLVRAKVELGEADAAVVYRTDAVASTRVKMLPVPAAYDVRADYLIAAVVGSDHADAAAAFVAYVSTGAGREALTAQGFTVDDLK